MYFREFLLHFGVFIVVVLQQDLCVAADADESSPLNITYTLIDESAPTQAIVSPDGLRLAFVGPAVNEGVPDRRYAAGSRPVTVYQLKVNGIPGPKFEEIGHPFFSPDSRHFCYFAANGAVGERTNYIIVDNTTRYSIGNAMVSPLQFSSDSKHVWCLSLDQNQTCRLLIDGQAGPAFNQLQMAPRFSSQNVATYIITRNLPAPSENPPHYFLIRNGKETEISRRFALSGDGLALAEAEVTEENRVRVMFGGKQHKHYEHFSSLTVSKDGRHVAYAAGSKIDGMFPVIDGVEKPLQIPLLLNGHMVFSPDGQHIAMVVQDAQDHEILARDGVLQDLKCDSIISIAFSPDSHHLVYMANIQGIPVTVIDGKKWSPVHDEAHPYASQERFRETTRIGLPEGQPSIIFSPDGRRIAHIEFLGYTSGDAYLKYVVVVDGVQGPPLENIIGVTFSPDGKHLAYCGLRNRNGRSETYIVIDGHAEKCPWPISGRFAFAPDGSVTFYTVQADMFADPKGLLKATVKINGL